MVNVVYACNDGYVRQTIVSMVSVIEYNPMAELYLISDGISEANRRLTAEKLEKFGKQVRILELEDVLPEIHFDEGDRHPKTVYAKLFLGDIIREKRILYLDSDVIVTGSLEPLFTRKMEGKTIGGVLMPYSSKLKKRVGCAPCKPYICDGVVLFDLETWRKNGRTEGCLDYIRRHQGKPPMLSEGTLNHICLDEIEVLEPKYNLMPSMLTYDLKQIRMLFRADCYYERQEELDEAKEKPVMIHFMNELYNRPWFEPCDHPMKEEYRKRYKQLFENAVYENQNLSLNTRLTRILRDILPFPIFKKLYHLKHKEIL